MDFKGQRLGGLWRRCGTLWDDMARSSWPSRRSFEAYFIFLRVVMFESPRLWGFAESVIIGTPYSVRDWCRFLTKLSRLLNKTDCFQPVSFGTPCNPQFRCRGVSIINFACVMTDSRPLKNSQTAAEELQSSIFVLKLCLLAEMNP